MSRANSHPKRIIVRLDIKGPDVVKGIQFEGVRRVGTPGDLARKYYADGADEIVFIDSVASLYGRNNILEVVSATARDVFVPLTVGGGLRSVDDIRSALQHGADKVAINTAAVQNPDLVRVAAEYFGSQCIMVSVQAIRRAADRWEVCTDNARERSGRSVLDWVVQAEALGAGELLITSVDQEGTMRGFDEQLLAEVHKRVSIPVIACGGAGKAEHVIGVLQSSCAEAVACASIFHHGHLTVSSLKNAVSAAGIPVRV